MLSSCQKKVEKLHDNGKCDNRSPFSNTKAPKKEKKMWMRIK